MVEEDEQEDDGKHGCNDDRVCGVVTDSRAWN